MKVYIQNAIISCDKTDSGILCHCVALAAVVVALDVKRCRRCRRRYIIFVKVFVSILRGSPPILAFSINIFYLERIVCPNIKHSSSYFNFHIFVSISFKIIQIYHWL